MDINGYLVRPEAAESQIEAEKAKGKAGVPQPPVCEPLLIKRICYSCFFI
jgi:hypothetical protein